VSDDALAGLPDDRAWSREVYEQAIQRKRADGACAACGKRAWGVADGLVLLPALDKVGRYVPGRGVEVVVLYCRRCGLLRLHEANRLLGD
jgi:ribosomal protein L37E